MPPKKAKAAGENGNAADKTSFTWTPELHQKLMFLVFQPRTVPVAEHETLAQLIGKATNGPPPTAGAIRNRIGKIRTEQKAAYKEAGLTFPGDGSTTPAATPSKGGKATPGGKKRAAKLLDNISDADAVDDDEVDEHLNKKIKQDPECDYRIKNDILEDFGLDE